MSGETSAGSGGPWSLDAVDTQLLTLLAGDARTSLRSLGAAVGLSGPAVADRIERLTQRGVIRGFTVDIDWALLGVPTLAHISLLTDKSSQIETIVGELRTIDGVEEVSIVTGATDLLVRARVADLTELRQLLVECIWPIAGVQRVETTLAVETVRAPGFVAGMLGRGPVAGAARPSAVAGQGHGSRQASKESHDHALTLRRYAAFSDDPAGGNPAGVVLNAADLTEGEMQRVAAEVGYSETAFVAGPIDGDRSTAIPVRYFAPEGEVDFCGHATIATAVAIGGGRR